MHASQAAPSAIVAASPDAATKVELDRAAALTEDKAIAPKRGRHVLALWVLLIVIFLAIWTVLAPPAGSRPPPSPAPDDSVSGEVVAPVVALAVIAMVGYQLVRGERLARRLLSATLDIARGDEERAASTLTALANGQAIAIAAAAHHGLAYLSERHARWSEVIADCDRGIAKLGRYASVRATQTDVMLPELIALRAMALAATGRQPEADAELALLSRDFPTFAFAGRAHFRTQLVAAVKSGDVARAAEVARSRTLDLPLSLRDDTLADIALALANELPKDEIARLAADLREDAKLRSWIDSLAPGSTDRLVAAGDAADAAQLANAG